MRLFHPEELEEMATGLLAEDPNEGELLRVAIYAAAAVIGQEIRNVAREVAELRMCLERPPIDRRH
jgi:hypothetical protein